MILPIDPLIHQQLERAVEQCGVAAADVRITYEDLLQSEQILVKSKKLGDDQVRCLAKIERDRPHPILAYEDPEVSKRSYEISHQEERKSAREWLERRGLLGSLPSYDPGVEDVGSFARKLESLCGIEPGSMLEFRGIGILTVKSSWAESTLHQKSSQVEEDEFICLLNIISASNLEENGVRFGFIGNEAYPEKKSKP